MSEMSSKMEQVLEYLVNGESDKAEALLHDVIVEKARSIHEELVNTTEEAVTETEEAVDETKAEATEEEAVEEAKADDSEEDKVEETVGGETGDVDTDLKSELKAKTEEDSEEIEYEETNEDDGDEDGKDDDHDHEEVEDKVDDLAQALEELKAKFDDIVNGGGEEEAGEEDEAPAIPGMEDEADESMEAPVESTQELEEAELKPVKVASPDGSDNGKSPVASKNDMGGTASNIVAGGDEKGATAPKAADMGATTEPNMSEVKADTTDGADKTAQSIVGSK